MEKIINKIKKHKIISIIRINESSQIESIVGSLYKGGIRVVEVTLNTPNAFEAIKKIRKIYPDMIVGAGTVLDEMSAKLAIDSGASFLLSPILDKKTIELANRYNILIVPGVLTPTEALTAYNYGARMIKIFPARSLSPSYISDLKGPLPQLDIMAVGGISLENAEEFLSKGCSSLGIGGSIVNNYDIEKRNFLAIENKAKEFVEIAKK
ncbi:bifunctional 4-hydroxy-2-oxoglutarate aldolase/2-dehydro-3-deoxy-phosphogluconate aldolase [Senegalia massiliensis]|uniref:Bifunctional 4-hydroxy-2-oxoglutarate aldolase/2-dehydro-3-deoxy-phosphogluconate aldolase n=1 Tax=Senegalia massiliensis TaxID=1720316 RepID=A0A845QY62_9CLOT|nr:bifunctional 4-hydroxy-2-oxoglutarate aldolase/2-dehydro-3-deoxy-phosphogluconate aldolase [Senegalia massiliensis]NBI07100.1 bifunctional 4-hydroxy-2-oxoglutarate aldolase/2-dehydro-3-deoxy-phosphogluconate aldolase [Senegalia massiliensis]